MKKSTFLPACLLLIAALACNGATTVKFGSAMEVEIDGVAVPYEKNATFVAPDGLHVYRMRPQLNAGERTYGIKGTEHSYTASRFPLHGESDNWVPVALPDDGSTVTLTGCKVSNTYYVDAEHGNDAWDGTTDYAHRDENLGKGPKRSLQAAHDCAEEGSDSAGYPIVLASPGVYDEGVTNIYSSGTSDLCKRRLHVSKRISFIATEGADRTFVVGAPDPENGACGANAVGGIYASGSGFKFLQGFTITGCYSPSTQSKANQYGAAFCSESVGAYLLDCVISNNFAVKYSAANSGSFFRTRIYDNESTNYVARNCYFVSCMFAGNRITASNNAYNDSALAEGYCSFYFCTFDLRNDLQRDGRSRLEHSGSNLYGSFAYGVTATPDASRWHCSVNSDSPLFADADARDYRIGMLSPAIDAASYADFAAEARRFLTADVDGLPPVVRDGKVRIGAVWNEPPLPVTVLDTADGGMSISGGTAGTNVVLSAEEITVTATKAATRPFVGFEVNGEMIPYAGTSYAFTPSLEAGSVTSVKAIYGTDWYVDCVNGNDSNGGGSAALAKATIRAATTNAANGDVIHVAPGTYGALEGAQTWPNGSEIGTRVIIPEGVTVVGTEGAENTFIVGAAASGGSIGAGAVRCVVANNNAVLRGFTLTGGHTHARDSASSYDRTASAFYSVTARAATMEDCIISNNTGYRYTINQSVVRCCRVIGNRILLDGNGGSAGSTCKWYGSVIADNVGNSTIHYPQGFEQCTVKGNTYNDREALVIYNAQCPIVNSAVIDGKFDRNNDSGPLYCTNCLLPSAQTSWTSLPAEQLHNTIFAGAAESVVDERHCPVLGQFAGIDRGDAAYSSDALGDADLYNTPRILNGTIDIGAVEYDWRPTFAQALGRRFTVDYASPSVTTNATGGLLVVDGEVAGKVNSARPYEIAFDVTAGGLSVYVGDELVGRSSGTGEQSINFRVKDASDEIRLVVEAPGSVVLKKFVGTLGFVIRYM